MISGFQLQKEWSECVVESCVVCSSISSSLVEGQLGGL